MSNPRSYEESGVSIARGDAASADALNQLPRTFTPIVEALREVVSVKLPVTDLREPRLALSSDGVGTKLKYAFASGRHTTVGIDAVAMVLNDFVRNNIKPIAFASYVASSELESQVIHDVIAGLVEGCAQADCAYTTGETAEMPGFYNKGEYDVAGFGAGIFDKTSLITGEDIKEGDVVFGLPSSGLHSNGYSLVRSVFPPEQVANEPELLDQVLKPTRVYVKTVLAVNQHFRIHGWAHITGGGVIGKLGKIIPEGLQARISLGSWDIPSIFGLLQQEGVIPDEDMWQVFNMGLGMIGVAPRDNAQVILLTFSIL